MRGLIGFVGFMIVLGATGTSDLEVKTMLTPATPLWQLAIMASIGLMMMCIGSSQPKPAVSHAQRR